MVNKISVIALFVAFIPLVPFTANAEQDDICIGPDGGSFSAAPIDLSFDSRVDPPAPDGRRYRFIRCIQTNTRQYFDANWQIVDLRGTVEYGRPLRSVLPLLSGDFTEVSSFIGVQLNRQSEVFRAAALLSKREDLGEWDVDRQRENSDVRTLLDQIIESYYDQPDREELRRSLELVSQASLGFRHPQLESPIFIEFSVASQFPERDNELMYGANYTIRASLVGDADENQIFSALEETPVSIRPRGVFEIVDWYENNRALLLSELLSGEGRTFFSQPIPVVSLYPVETSFSLIAEDREIARFPASLYSDLDYVPDRRQ